MGLIKSYISYRNTTPHERMKIEDMTNTSFENVLPQIRYDSRIPSDQRKTLHHRKLYIQK
jgi:hypothetical protein